MVRFHQWLMVVDGLSNSFGLNEGSLLNSSSLSLEISVIGSLPVVPLIEALVDLFIALD
jgi:hypothetical protein